MAPKIKLREYTDFDSNAVGILIADTFLEYNLSFADSENQRLLMGPFYYARSADLGHQKAIKEALQSPMAYLAESDGQIAGILRGREGRLASLFVAKPYHFQGIGRLLVAHFEGESKKRNVSVIQVAATLYAVNFYAKLGYRKIGEILTTKSFDGDGLPYQPMEKTI